MYRMFFGIFWLLLVLGGLYLGREFNTLWHADMYPLWRGLLTGAIAVAGLITTIYWYEVQTADPTKLSFDDQMHTMYARTFYWRAWSFSRGGKSPGPYLWDDFLTIFIAASACFMAAHFAGSVSDGVDYLWLFWAAIALAGCIPTWIRSQWIMHWAAHLNDKAVVENEGYTPEPSDPPKSRWKLFPKKERPLTEDGKVVPLRPGDGKDVRQRA